MADPQACVQVRVLYENWLEQRKHKDDRSVAERLFLIHAVLICVRAKKSRTVDTALITMYEAERPRMEIPDCAIDLHTLKGRRMGRGVDHFFDEGAKLENEGFGCDPYHDRARTALKKKHEQKSRKLNFEDLAVDGAETDPLQLRSPVVGSSKILKLRS
jgi:hypothetical protein